MAKKKVGKKPRSLAEREKVLNERRATQNPKSKAGMSKERSLDPAQKKIVARKRKTGRKRQTGN
jgi:hypothetical protein